MPVDRGVIDAQLREIGAGERWWEQREFRDLPYILHPEERIAGLVNGRLLGRRRLRVRPGGSWLIVATDERLICLRQKRFGRMQVEIGAGQILGARQASRLRSHEIIIETAQRRFRLRIPREDAFRFGAAISALLSQPDQPANHHGHQLPPGFSGMSVLSAVPGFSGIISRVAMLSAPEPASRASVEELAALTERLQDDVERLQQQVEFLENLLQTRAGPPLVSLLEGGGSEPRD